MYLQPEDLLKLGMAVLAGGLIGIEREFRDKAAGFRTLIFICLGATLFTILSSRLAGVNDPTRIAAGIVAGVGFLGAGVIMRDSGRVVGLTTAAAIWLTAALGMSIGGGEYALAAAGLAVSLAVLWFLPWFEQRIDNLREERTYVFACGAEAGKLSEIDAVFRQCGLRVRRHRQDATRDKITCSWNAFGSLQAHDRLVRELTADESIHELRF
jgi:putative Mg2+ transporter-C (MgtC) family protein